MFKQFLKFSVRVIAKDKFFSFIKIFGLSISLAMSFLILLFVLHETGYDKFHKNRKRIYRLIVEESDVDYYHSSTAFILGPTLKSQLPEVQNYARIYTGTVSVKNGDSFIDEYSFSCADNSLFDIFTIPFLQGNPDNALIDPFSLVITNEMAVKYFGNQNPLGKYLNIKIKGELFNYQVTGVIADFPKNSTIQVNFIGDISLRLKQIENDLDHNKKSAWKDKSFSTYILAQKKANPVEIENKINLLSEGFQKLRIKFHLQPLRDVYLHKSKLPDYGVSRRNKKDIKLFSFIGITILIVGGINFILLTTAKTINRSKEIAVNKIFGATRKIIITQALFESLFFSLVSLPIALILSYLFLNPVGELLNRDLIVEVNQYFQFFYGIILITLFLGLIPGTIIALYFSKISLVSILKSKINTGSSKPVLRSGLILIELVTFLVLLNITGIVFKQIRYIETKDLGLNKENLIVLSSFDPSFSKNYSVIKHELLKNPNVISVTGSPFGIPTPRTGVVSIPRFDDPTQEAIIDAWIVDFNFIETFGFQLMEGRDFSENIPSEAKNSVIINEKAQRELGLTNPIGVKLTNKTIIGVLKDFHLYPLNTPINPLIINIFSRGATYIYIKTYEDSYSNIIPFLENTLSKFNTNTTFNFYIFEDFLDLFYKKEQKLSKILSVFSIISVLVASLGLFGLFGFVLRESNRVIAIRKVFGSSSFKIMVLFAGRYFKLLFMANLISIPIAFYFMNQWLQNYSYSTRIGFLIFLLSGIFSCLILILTIGFQTYKVSNTNPTDTLRHE